MSETFKGTVIWWNRKKGYGIADTCEEERQILLYWTQITSGYKKGEEVYLRGGDPIEFETHTVNPNIAKNIRLSTTLPCSQSTRQGTTLYEVDTDEEEY